MTDVMLASYFLCGQVLLFCDIEFEKKPQKNYFLSVEFCFFSKIRHFVVDKEIENKK